MKTDTETGLAELRQEVEKFEQIQAKFCAVGAQDTEPDAIFQYALWDTINGKEPRIPRTAEDWELYSGQPKSNVAANQLTNQLKRLVKKLQGMRLNELGEIRKYLHDVCWRAS